VETLDGLETAGFPAAEWCRVRRLSAKSTLTSRWAMETALKRPLRLELAAMRGFFHAATAAIIASTPRILNARRML
jgi:hypothetical protein